MHALTREGHAAGALASRRLGDVMSLALALISVLDVFSGQPKRSVPATSQGQYCQQDAA